MSCIQQLATGETRTSRAAYRLGVGSGADLGFEEIRTTRDEAGERAQDLT